MQYDIHKKKTYHIYVGNLYVLSILEYMTSHVLPSYVFHHIVVINIINYHGVF